MSKNPAGKRGAALEHANQAVQTEPLFNDGTEEDRNYAPSARTVEALAAFIYTPNLNQEAPAGGTTDESAKGPGPVRQQDIIPLNNEVHPPDPQDHVGGNEEMIIDMFKHHNHHVGHGHHDQTMSPAVKPTLSPPERSETVEMLQALVAPFEETNSKVLEHDHWIYEKEDDSLRPRSKPHESYEPSPSVQLLFEDSSKNNEAYGPTLQYSRPSAKSTHTINQDGRNVPIDNVTTFDALHSPSFPLWTSYNTLTRRDFLHEAQNSNVELSGDDFPGLDDEGESELIDLTAKASDGGAYPTAALPQQPIPKLLFNPPQYYKSTQTSSMSKPEIGPTKTTSLLSSANARPITPVTGFTLGTPSSSSTALTSPSPQLLAFEALDKPLPFARPPFPNSVFDRSPISGVSSHTVRRTCFRIGEAINAASVCSRKSLEAIIELYARVTYSKRETSGVRQHFQFADMFRSEHPPYLGGTYDQWKTCELWNMDSRAFLGHQGKGKLARVIGKMKRDGKTQQWKMVILSVWEASYDDVEWVKGIVCG